MGIDILLGIVSVIIGVAFLWFTKKYPERKLDIFSYDIKGYLGGVICIIGGILLILKALMDRG